MKTPTLFVALFKLYHDEMQQHEKIVLELPKRLFEMKEIHADFKNAGFEYIVVSESAENKENIKIIATKVVK